MKTQSRRYLPAALILLLLGLVSACDSADPIASSDTGTLSKQGKTLLCHIGNKVLAEGPYAGLTYTQAVIDGGCDPFSEVCPDAGKIDLVDVSNPAKHLENPSHVWEGQYDYLPGDVGASGDGNEDTDGDGIDEGCEIPAGACPCWDESALEQVTAENQFSARSCSGYAEWAGLYPPDAAIVQDTDGIDEYGYFNGDGDEIEGGFGAAQAGVWMIDEPFCLTRDFPPTDDPDFPALMITPAEAATCIQQIVDHCAEIGDPIPDGPSAPASKSGAPAVTLKKFWGR